jgi:hypothetical protein
MNCLFCHQKINNDTTETATELFTVYCQNPICKPHSVYYVMIDELPEIGCFTVNLDIQQNKEYIIDQYDVNYWIKQNKMEIVHRTKTGKSKVTCNQVLILPYEQTILTPENAKNKLLTLLIFS